MEPTPQKRLGEHLVAEKIIRQDQLETALREQQRRHRLLGEVLVEMGFVSSDVLYPIIAEWIDVSYVDLARQILTTPVGIPGISGALVLEEDDESIQVAMADPHNIFHRHKIRLVYPGKDLVVFLAAADQIRALLAPQSAKAMGVPSNKSAETVVAQAQRILQEAIGQGASDVHFTPLELSVVVSFRVDGLLQEIQTIHREGWGALKSHLKVLSQLDLAENRRPQDGRFSVSYQNRSIDCRLSIIPTTQGESVVIRLLDRDRVDLKISGLGLLPMQQGHLRKLAVAQEGLFIVAGPTGSGKTTTIYGMLDEIMPQGRNIITVEDPVEYRMDGIRQVEVQPGVTGFAQLLRSMLRHDPDVIYISEIRDEETAQIAVRAALTGHLVVSTLHARNTASIPQRLMDLGVSPQLLSGTLLGMMSQRLEATSTSDCGGRRIVAEILECDNEFRSICEENPSWLAFNKWYQQHPAIKMDDVRRTLAGAPYAQVA